jgi:3-deoxy-manno-octulosonate cytidylyltransferase (CMP-KDO synthetase)
MSMARPSNPIVVVPARMASSRLPGKPLADLAGEPMIVHVWRRAVAAGIGPVLVACAELEIAAAVRAVGGTAVLTRPDHPSGSDRVHEAVEQVDPQGRHDVVINLQGDALTPDPGVIAATLVPLAEPAVDIGTIAVPFATGAEERNPNFVKAVISLAPDARVGRALYFSREPVPGGEGPMWHHIGLYAYRRQALRRFVTLPPAPLEQRERLEQLRALEHGMRIDVALVDSHIFDVNTPEDLARARALLARR